MQANVLNAFRKAAIGLIAVLAAACQLPGLDRVGSPEEATDRAQRQSRAGDFAAAARTYESAARAAPAAEANTLWLAAAGEWISGGDLAAAQNAISMLAPPVSTAEAHEKLRLEAEMTLAGGDAARALAMLRDLPPDGNAAVLATRARIQFGAKRVAEAVRSLIERERKLTNARDP
jgi:outer membrane PBP1 activator LpoA protein